MQQAWPCHHGAVQQNQPPSFLTDAVARRRTVLALGVAGVAAAAALPAALACTDAIQAIQQVRLAVGSRDSNMFRHLPLDIAHQLGFFAPEGVLVTLQSHPSDAAALQAMHDGRADLCGVDFEQLLRAPRSIAAGARCFVLQGRAPQVALGVSLRQLPNFRALADLPQTAAIGVCALGSLAHTVASLALEQAGVALHTVSFVAVGEGVRALAALRAGRVQALCHGDPLMTQLEQQDEVRIAADTRTLAGTQALFGGMVPGGCLVAPASMLQGRATAVQAVAHGVVHALKWLQTAAPADMVKVLPKVKPGTGHSVTLAAFARVRETFSPDGSIPADAPATALRALRATYPLAAADVQAPEGAVLHAFARKAKLKFSA